ncbi:hypothetical protein EQG63_01140 [Flavobacterium amnicola]|uniref:Zinc-dependent peptidase n=1 Tax=Flavobacterium amnicola TaxID=2506422 RepID=A0A4Q1K4C8_9FLAO|nr:zinc-dependent peptidase [Flavobacterium amnicola]RXR20568.1 hypothetical protein EQG63_01140 [Flavobacterium amnicola]
MFLFFALDLPTEDLHRKDVIMASVLTVFFGFCFLLFFIQVLEVVYIRTYKKPFLVFTHLVSNKLTESQQSLLEHNFSFYNRLKPKYKRYFEHRVNKFISQYHFESRNIELTEEMKLLIAAVYVKLTFGQRLYLSKVFTTIVIYPNAYFSDKNQQYHKGEFNPLLKQVIFSWEDFTEGIRITNDNLNLGLHEFTHVLHIETKITNSFKSVLFKESLQSLFGILDNQELRENLISSGFFRTYAFENQYEFVAVLLEYFFESPSEFKSQFPEIYLKVRQMINYNENHFVSS